MYRGHPIPIVPSAKRSSHGAGRQPHARVSTKVLHSTHSAEGSARDSLSLCTPDPGVSNLSRAAHSHRHIWLLQVSGTQDHSICGPYPSPPTHIHKSIPFLVLEEPKCIFWPEPLLQRPSASPRTYIPKQSQDGPPMCLAGAILTLKHQSN